MGALARVHERREQMARNKQITGVQAAQIADELGRREPLKLLSSSVETDKHVVALTRNPGEGGKKAPPRLRNHDHGVRLGIPTSVLLRARGNLPGVPEQCLADSHPKPIEKFPLRL